MKHAGVSPRTLQRLALASSAVWGFVAAVTLVLWMVEALPNTRLTMAVYLSLVLLAVGSGCVALFAACQVAIHQAFRAGFQTGQVAAEALDPMERARERAARGKDDPVLRLLQ